MMGVKNSTIAFQMFWKNSLTAVHTVFHVSEIHVQAVVMASLTVCTMGVMKATIAFHTFMNTVLMPFQIVTNTAATTMKQFLMNSPIGMTMFCTYA